MKQLFVKRLFIMGAVVITIPAVTSAQQENNKKNKNEEVQQIIITRKGNTEDKTTIEINGEKVKINGKDASDERDNDVSVKINKFRGMDNLNHFEPPQPPQPGTWNFNDNGMGLFSEDENRAMLGVVTDENEKGAEITQISEGSAAAKAGLKKGDIITKIDDEKVENASDVANIVHSHKPGEKITINILRDSKEQKVTAELGKWKGVRMRSFKISPNDRLIAPEGLDNVPRVAPEPFDFNLDNNFNTDHPKLGMSIQDTEDGKGVKVTDVDEDSNAGKAGIKEDDIITGVNDKEVNSADEISRMVKENRDKNSINFKVLRNGKIQNIVVHMPKKIKTVDL